MLHCMSPPLYGPLAASKIVLAGVGTTAFGFNLRYSADELIVATHVHQLAFPRQVLLTQHKPSLDG
jgi:hypothetical protein